MARLDQPESPSSKEEAQQQTCQTFRDRRKGWSISIQTEASTTLEDSPTLQRETLDSIRPAGIP